MTGVLLRNEWDTDVHTQEERLCEDMGEDSLLQAKERDHCWVLELRLLVSGGSNLEL